MRLGETNEQKIHDFYSRNDRYVRGRIAMYNPDKNEDV